ncbi:MAG: hypothetical protein ACYTDT_11215 [Planctomycetota bacterium]|jgi:hypothetical protein
MNATLDNVTRASIPLAKLSTLAPLRLSPEVEIIVETDRAWLHWSGSASSIIERLLPIDDVKLFYELDGNWFPLGSRLPVNAPDLKPALSLSELIQPVVELPLQHHRSVQQPSEMSLVPSTEPQPVTASLCRLQSLKTYAENATTAQLRGLEVAQAQGLVLIRGSSIPLIDSAERYWGVSVLCPLGFKPSFGLPDDVLIRASGAGATDILLIRHKRTEVIPTAAFKQASLASIRLASA